ncbi:neurotransmitter-gated ion-channel ligand binding domain-containing protein [Ditylenchus destructor]|uniref:Neurotransmitter-gated ion-channel ligand binding domain-containing protein n=1 Tax=Ditylenchus destructor TaxID=166010 RepID=A0AAD4R7T8_9BILA|nr:neurotransmitter-gated ion-channel ligand binding domain-containing protein [Ditylenchus destructor]
MLALQLIFCTLLLREVSLVDSLVSPSKGQRGIVGPLLGQQLTTSPRDNTLTSIGESRSSQQHQNYGSSSLFNRNLLDERLDTNDENPEEEADSSGGVKANKMSQQTDEQRLLYFLLRQYERAVRPVRNASDAVVVKLGMTLTNIFDMDEKNQVFSINVWLDQEWKDELLQWNPEDFNGIKSLRVPCDLIWTPDIVLYNSAEDYTHGYMRSRAMVFYDGTVFWPPPTRLRSTCKISVTYFPFDSQHCSLKFGSWTYHGYQVDVTNRSINIDLSNYVESGEFELVSVHQKRRVVKYTCCEEPYPDLTFYIHIRRKTLYYLYNIVFPCLMMSILTLLVFFLPPDSGEKIALGITVLLAFSVFVLAIAEKMPETSDSIPLIGIYLTSVMAMTSISVIMTVMVLNFHHRGPFNKPVPPWVHDMVLNKIRNVLRMRMPYSGFVHSIGPGIASIGNGMLCGLNINTQLVTSATHTNNKADTQRDHFANSKHFYSCENNVEAPLYQTSNGVRKEETKRLLDDDYSKSPQRIPVQNDSFNRSKRRKRDDPLQEKLLKTLEMLTTRQDNDDRLQLMANEWRQVAQVIDRLLFWIFFFATGFITLTLLIIIPVLHRATESTEFDESLYGLHKANT